MKTIFKKNIILYLIGTFFCFSSYSQTEQLNKRKIILSPGISFQRQFFGEINLMYAQHAYGGGTFGIFGPRIGIETNFNHNHFLYAPKIGYEMSILNITLRGNIINYIDQNRTDLRLLPEISITSIVVITLTYGYSIPILKFETSELSRHRISLIFNLDIALWRVLFKQDQISEKHQ